MWRIIITSEFLRWTKHAAVREVNLFVSISTDALRYTP